MADKWIHKVRSNTLQKRLFTDLEKGLFTDITFQVGPDGNQRTFKAHRLVLASESSEFERMLHSADDSVKIKILDVHPKGFENLIRYCYGEGFFFKDIASIRETYIAAEKFKAKKVQLTAEKNLIDLLKSESLIEILKVCIELDMPRAKERCLEAISSRFDKVLMTEELALAPIAVIESILSLCQDHGLDVKISALCSILAWSTQNECPQVITRHLLSIMQDERITSDLIISFFKRRGGKLPDYQFKDFPNCLFLKEAFSPQKNIFQESTNAIGNTDVVSREYITDTQVESSEVEHETSLDLQSSGVKDQKEFVIDREEAYKLKGVNISDTDDASDGDGDGAVIEEAVIRELIEEASDLIKSTLSESLNETATSIAKVTEEIMRHAAEKMQKSFDDMFDALTYLTTSNSNTMEKTEVKSV